MDLVETTRSRAAGIPERAMLVLSAECCADMTDTGVGHANAGGTRPLPPTEQGISCQLIQLLPKNKLAVTILVPLPYYCPQVLRCVCTCTVRGLWVA